MKHHNLLIASLFLALYSITGCALLREVPREESIKTLIEQQQYEKAAQRLSSLTGSEDDPKDIAAQQNYIKRLIRKLEKETISTANSYEENGDLAKAIRVLEEGLSKIPSSQQLKELHNALQEERDTRLQRTEHRLLLAQAKYMLERKELIIEQNRVNGEGFFSRWQRKKTENRLPKIALELLLCGTEAMKRGEISLAGECLLVSQQISDTREVQQALDQWRQAQESVLRVRTRTDKSKQKKVKEIGTLRKNTLVALADSKYELVHDYLEKLNKLNGIDSEIQQVIGDNVKKLITHGNREYRSGHIKEARDIWNQVLLIDPNNDEAMAHIKRAEKILNRLEELRR